MEINQMLHIHFHQLVSLKNKKEKKRNVALIILMNVSIYKESL